MAYGNIAGWGRGPYGIGAYGQPITSGGWGDAGPPELDIKKIKLTLKLFLHPKPTKCPR